MGNTILIVDHDSQSLSMISDYLFSNGFKVFPAQDGHKALSIFQEHKPDLVICEFLLPGMNGLEVVKQIRSDPAGRNVKIIMTSQIIVSSALIRQFKENVSREDILLGKPFAMPDLLNHVCHLLKIKPGSISKQKAGDKIVGSESESTAKRPMRDSSPLQSQKREAVKESRQASQKSSWSGTLSDVPLYRILGALHQKKATGRLMVKKEAINVDIIFKSGEVIAVKSNYIMESTLGSYLIKSGLISKSKYDLAFQKASKEKRQAGELLVELEFLTRPELMLMLRKHMEEKLAYILLARKGLFEFTQGSVASESDLEGLDLAKTIFSELHKHAKEVEVSTKLDPYLNSYVLLSDETPFSPDELALFPDEAIILRMADGNHTVHQILSRGQNPRSVAAAMYVLRLIHVIKFVDRFGSEVKTSQSQQ